MKTELKIDFDIRIKFKSKYNINLPQIYLSLVTYQDNKLPKGFVLS